MDLGSYTNCTKPPKKRLYALAMFLFGGEWVGLLRLRDPSRTSRATRLAGTRARQRDILEQRLPAGSSQDDPSQQYCRNHTLGLVLAQGLTHGQRRQRDKANAAKMFRAARTQPWIVLGCQGFPWLGVLRVPLVGGVKSSLGWGNMALKSSGTTQLEKRRKKTLRLLGPQHATVPLQEHVHLPARAAGDLQTSGSKPNSPGLRAKKQRPEEFWVLLVWFHLRFGELSHHGFGGSPGSWALRNGRLSVVGTRAVAVGRVP